MLAVLRSRCAEQAHIDGSIEFLPVRYVYALVLRDGTKVSVQYREFDGPCKVVSADAGQWTLEQFEDAKIWLKRTGIGNGQFLAPSESSGDGLPVSFLKVRAPDYDLDVYTMYLRFRWTGEMKTENPVIAKALDEWKALLREATPVAPKKSGIEEIVRISDNCAKDWPPSFNSSVCSEARQITQQPRAYDTGR
jgi:hypothetical protein